MSNAAGLLRLLRCWKSRPRTLEMFSTSCGLSHDILPTFLFHPSSEQLGELVAHSSRIITFSRFWFTYCSLHCFHFCFPSRLSFMTAWHRHPRSFHRHFINTLTHSPTILQVQYVSLAYPIPSPIPPHSFAFPLTHPAHTLNLGSRAPPAPHLSYHLTHLDIYPTSDLIHSLDAFNS